MAFSLAGSAGAAVTSSSGGSISTLAWGTSENRTLLNLLVLYVDGYGTATLPAAPTGWSIAKQIAGTSCSSSIFYKVAAGGDAAPTVAAVTSTILIASLAEFNTGGFFPVLDKTGSGTGTSTPLVATASAADIASGALALFTGIAFYSASKTFTLTPTGTNFTATSAANNSGVSSADRYYHGYGVTTANASADSVSNAYSSTTNVTGEASVIATFRLASSFESEMLSFYPRHYWRLNETSGTTVNDEGSAIQQGIYTGGFTLDQTGLTRSGDPAVLLNGSTGFVQTTTTHTLNTTQAAIGIFFKTTVAGGIMSLATTDVDAGGTSDYAIYVGTDGKLYAGMFVSPTYITLSSPGTVNDGNWHLAAVSWPNAANNNMQLILDGQVVATNTNTTAMPTASLFWLLGLVPGVSSWPNGSGDFFNGTISEAFLFLVLAGTSGALPSTTDWATIWSKAMPTSGSVTAGDSLTFSDSSSANTSGSRTSSDSLTLSDSAGGSGGASRTSGDSLTFGSTAAGSTGGARTASDTMSFGETPKATGSAIQKVQDTTVNNGSANPLTISLSGVKSGNQLILAVLAGGSMTVSGVTGGGTWAKIANLVNTGLASDLELWWCSNATGGSTTVSVTWSATPSATSEALWLSEWSGISGLDGSGATNTGTTLTPTSPSLTPVAVGDLVLMAVNPQHQVTSSPASPWINISGATWFNGSNGAPLAWQIATATTAYSCSWAMATGNNWTTLGALFRGVIINTSGSGTASDSLTFSDSASAKTAGSRTSSDSLTLSDSAAGSRGGIRSVSDSLTLGSTATANTAASRTTSDSLTLASTAAAKTAASRTSADSLTFGSTAAVTNVSGSRTAADSVTLASTASANTAASRTTSDSLTFGSTASGHLGGARTSSDSLTFGDSAGGTVQVHASVTASDSVTLASIASAKTAASRTTSDSLTFASTAHGSTAGGSRTAADSLSFTDSVVAHAGGQKTTSDSLTLNSTAKANTTASRTTSETLTLASVAAAKTSGSRTTSDTITFGSTARANTAETRAPSAAFSFSDSATASATHLRTASDSLSFNSTAVGHRTGSRTAFDSLTFSSTAAPPVKPFNSIQTWPYTNISGALGSLHSGGGELAAAYFDPSTVLVLWPGDTTAGDERPQKIFFGYDDAGHPRIIVRNVPVPLTQAQVQQILNYVTVQVVS